MSRLLLIAILVIVAWKISMAFRETAAESAQADAERAAATAVDARLREEIRNAAGIELELPR